VMVCCMRTTTRVPAGTVYSTGSGRGAGAAAAGGGGGAAAAAGGGAASVAGAGAADVAGGVEVEGAGAADVAGSAVGAGALLQPPSESKPANPRDTTLTIAAPAERRTGPLVKPSDPAMIRVFIIFYCLAQGVVRCSSGKQRTHRIVKILELHPAFTSGPFLGPWQIGFRVPPGGF
jgi:hypothetical protein